MPSSHEKERSSQLPLCKAPTALPPFDPLSEGELGFCWQSLAEGKRLSTSKLQQLFALFGERLSTNEAKDLLMYMDADGDGYVNEGDFASFLSVGELGDTDVKSFMWRQSVKREQGNMARGPSYANNFLNCTTLDAIFEDPRYPSSKGMFQHQPTLPENYQSVADMHRSAQLSTKIDASLHSYEEESWRRFQQEEAEFKTRLFECFAKDAPGHISLTEYHRTLRSWQPLIGWCMPGVLKSADAAAALEAMLDTSGENLESGSAVRLSFRAWLAAVASAHGGETCAKSESSKSTSSLNLHVSSKPRRKRR